ncbi:MAG: hypothetical protein R2865_01100 [Deinococcales bacterium]
MGYFEKRTLTSAEVQQLTDHYMELYTLLNTPEIAESMIDEWEAFLKRLQSQSLAQPSLSSFAKVDGSLDLIKLHQYSSEATLRLKWLIRSIKIVL